MRDVVKRWRSVLVAGMCVISLLGSALAQAQTAQNSAAVNGSVIDPEGKVVVNAAMLIRNEASADLRTTTTDATGRFP